MQYVNKIVQTSMHMHNQSPPKKNFKSYHIDITSDLRFLKKFVQSLSMNSNFFKQKHACPISNIIHYVKAFDF